MGGFGGPGGDMGGMPPYYKFDYAALRKEQGLEVRLGQNGAILGNFGGHWGHWRSLEAIGRHPMGVYGGLWGDLGGFGGSVWGTVGPAASSALLEALVPFPSPFLPISPHS